MNDVLMETNLSVAQIASLSPIPRTLCWRMMQMGYKVDASSSTITMHDNGSCTEFVQFGQSYGNGFTTITTTFHTGTTTRLIDFTIHHPHGGSTSMPLDILSLWANPSAGGFDSNEQDTIERQGRENDGLAMIEQFDTLEDLYRQEDATIPESVYGARLWFVTNGYMD